MSFYYKVSYLTWALLVVLYGCEFKGDEWSVTIPSIGSSPSPVATDLNQDGHLDIVIGGAAQEFTRVPASIIALDGKTGQTLWQVSGHNQMTGTAIFKDITADGTDDVFIGGRSATFKAINGRSGTVLWEYLPYRAELDYVNDTTLLNFYTAQWLPDADNDGVSDILTAYGGFVKARPGDTDRPAGYLIVLSGQTGKVLSRAIVPDGKETYMSPVVHDFGRGLEVIYGTGGEDISGNLYRVSLDSLLAGSLASSIVLLRGGNKGMIAPPILTDLTLDKIADVIISTVDGRLVAVDGHSGQELWSATPTGDFDTYVMAAPGYFTGDDAVPDFFASFGKGPWPDTEYTVHLLVDGSTGTTVYSDTLGSFQYASPVVADFDGDGKSDVVVCINNITEIGNEIDRQKYRSNDLYLFPGGRGPATQLFKFEIGTNLGSTPLLSDLDGDGYLDLISANMGDPLQFYSFRELKINRRELDVPASSISFGGYMGPGRKSLFE
jgi:outer membrane protein assembly factor BamB